VWNEKSPAMAISSKPLDSKVNSFLEPMNADRQANMQAVAPHHEHSLQSLLKSTYKLYLRVLLLCVQYRSIFVSSGSDLPHHLRDLSKIICLVRRRSQECFTAVLATDRKHWRCIKDWRSCYRDVYSVGTKMRISYQFGPRLSRV